MKLQNLKSKSNINEFNKFVNEHIKRKYKNNTILIDDAPFYRNKKIHKNIKKYRNQLMFCVLYNPFYSETGIIYVRHFNKIVL